MTVFPGNRGEIVFCDPFVEGISQLTKTEMKSILTDVITLLGNPVGKHALQNRTATDRLAGLNTVEVLGRKKRVIFGSRVIGGVGIIEVLCLGPRSNNAIYDTANALVKAGYLSNDEVSQIWDALNLLDVIAESVGMDGWDYAPPPGPDGMKKAAVRAGILEQEIANVLSKAELEAAMEYGWDDDGPNPGRAIAAALERSRSGVPHRGAEQILRGRHADRCDAIMPRAGVACIRRAGHTGACRATP